MAQDFKTFMGFSDPQMAQEIAAILAEAKILYNIYDSRKDFDPAFNNSELGKEILIQIRQQDFGRAESLVNEKMPFQIENADSDHFLFGFSNEELKEVVKRADEWHVLDVKLAKYLLQQKGISVSDEEMADFRKQELIEKSAPEKIKAFWLVVAYISALCIGPLGLLIGWYLSTLKKILPDGSQVYNYDKTDRLHGRLILFCGFLSAMTMLALKLKQ
jgi:hypothetical protein